jgi:ribosomal protein S18 acetylase RimI-like enzyme
MPIEIRRLSREDAPLVLAASELFDGPADPAATDRFLGLDDHHLFFALEDGVPIGFVSGVEITHPDKGTEMLLYELAVAERARRRGIGGQLVEALRRLAIERGCYAMWVLTEDDNAAALATYRRAGAREDERPRMLEWDLRGQPVDETAGVDSDEPRPR